MMKDFLGRELKVGDEVVFSIPHYHGLARAHIAKFAPKMVVLDVTVHGHKAVPMSEAYSFDRPTCRYPHDCVKVVR